jgi:hypothetical protein
MLGRVGLSTPDLRDRSGWRGNLHERPDANALSAIHARHTARDIRHRSARPASVSLATYYGRQSDLRGDQKFCECTMK